MPSPTLERAGRPVGALPLVGAATMTALGALALSSEGALVPVYLATHLLCLAGAWILRQRATGPTGRTSELLLVLCAGAGPFGALAFLFVALGLWRGQPPPSELASWHADISGRRDRNPAQRLLRALDSGRLRLDDAAPRQLHFQSVLEQAPRTDRLLALGLMARRYDRRLLPHIQAGLSNDDPLVRAQAAVIVNGLPEEDQRTVRGARRRQAGKARR